ncbi:DUF1064 domain-containing protein [Rhizobium laguerreae]|uniref:DUF1064 domain-containing protein n=1 Tax=Rhizobium laguerreae TaxID=1076926 RepID=UPI001C91F3AE|nr:DUF1064 domain-containing protein [Rhizobium laguerreae]MBY3073420.1 DUF1064 domain-containing protein [Rhizobium laguerreae]
MRQIILSREEGEAVLAQKPKRAKYGNKKVMIDGITFDSKREAAYYSELKIREKAGEVTGVEMQRPFALLGLNGALMATFRADFCFWDNTAGRFRCIDVKGFDTPVGKLKRKMMKGLLGIDVEIVK